MNIEAEFEIDLTVQSFAYVAEQLARSSSGLARSAQYEQILAEAEKHRSALRMVQRDVVESAEQGYRNRTLAHADYRRLRENAERTVGLAQHAITRIAAKYAPRKLAA